MVKVKICGITNIDDAISAQDAGADFLGFVFAQSPRRVRPQAAREIIRRVSSDVKIVALFVDEKKETVDKIISKLGRVDILQFHGSETPDYCSRFAGREVIKAFRVKDEASLKQVGDFKSVDFLLLDSFRGVRSGGTGVTFDWNLASGIKGYNIPVFLSGGLNPVNVREAILKVNPFAVDVSSGVEKEPGKKSAQLIKKFIAAAKTFGDRSQS